MIPKELGGQLVARLDDCGLSAHVIAQFTGVVDSTVQSWTKGRTPKGGKLNALWHLLNFAGVDSPELCDLPEFNRYLGELLAFNVISLEEAQLICGGLAEQAVWNILRGGRQPLSPEYSAEQLKGEYGEQLQQAQEKWRQRLGDAPRQDRSLSEAVVVRPIPAPAQQAPPVASERTTVTPFLLDLAIRLGALRPMLAYAVSDALSAEERAELRRLIGEEAMFAIRTSFQALSSERIRTTQER